MANSKPAAGKASAAPRLKTQPAPASTPTKPQAGARPIKRRSAAEGSGKPRAGEPAPSAPNYPWTEAQIAKGDWNPLWDQVRSLDPDFIEAYLAFRSVPHRKGPLPPHIKELILIAINVATTHLYAPGARRHMQNALRLGASAEEILEAIQLTTVLGIHAVNLAVPMLCEELEKAGKPLPGQPHQGQPVAVPSRSARALPTPQPPTTSKPARARRTSAR
jgi:alkylhydroperoxidase/carboxymuconolactone decarboxylase family protein YurZ